MPYVFSVNCFANSTVIAEAPSANELVNPEPIIEVETDSPPDQQIADRTVGVFAEIEFLHNVTAKISDGAVTLAGQVPNEVQAQSAMRLAIRLKEVVTVEDEIERTLAIEDNVKPMFNKFKDGLRDITRALPLV